MVTVFMNAFWYVMNLTRLGFPEELPFKMELLYGDPGVPGARAE